MGRRLVVVLMNPFWGTSPRYREVTSESLDAGDTITFTPETPGYAMAAAAEASQPHTREDPRGEETETVDEEKAPPPGAEAPTEAEPQAAHQAQLEEKESGVETPSIVTICLPNPTPAPMPEPGRDADQREAAPRGTDTDNGPLHAHGGQPGGGAAQGGAPARGGSGGERDWAA